MKIYTFKQELMNSHTLKDLQEFTNFETTTITLHSQDKYNTSVIFTSSSLPDLKKTLSHILDLDPQDPYIKHKIQ